MNTMVLDGEIIHDWGSLIKERFFSFENFSIFPTSSKISMHTLSLNVYLHTCYFKSNERFKQKTNVFISTVIATILHTNKNKTKDSSSYSLEKFSKGYSFSLTRIKTLSTKSTRWSKYTAIKKKNQDFFQSFFNQLPNSLSSPHCKSSKSMHTYWFTKFINKFELTKKKNQLLLQCMHVITNFHSKTALFVQIPSKAYLLLSM